MSIREERIKKSIEKEVMNLVVNGQIKDPRVPTLFTITKVSLSKDKHYSHIYISLTGSDKEKQVAVDGLNNAKGFIQMQLADKLQLRYTPKIEFRFDKYADDAGRVDLILEKIALENSINEKIIE